MKEKKKFNAGVEPVPLMIYFASSTVLGRFPNIRYLLHILGSLEEVNERLAIASRQLPQPHNSYYIMKVVFYRVTNYKKKREKKKKS